MSEPPTPTQPTQPQSNAPYHTPQAPLTPGIHQAATLPAMPTVAVGFQAQFHNSQFPPPETAERYERLYPGAFDRILTMAEKKQDAEISRQDCGLKASISDTRRAHWMGFSISGIALIGGFGLVCLGHSAAGLSIILCYGIGAGLSFFLRTPVGIFSKNRQQTHKAQDQTKK